MTIGPPIPEIQFDLEISRSKVKLKGTPVSTTSCWLISLVFHIRASYRVPTPSFHDNRASHSRDTNWPWKYKVKGKGQRYPSQHRIQFTHFLSVSHQGIQSIPVPFVPWQSGLPFPKYNLTLNIQDQRYPSQHSIQLTSLVLHIRASYRLPSLSLHDNCASHSRDTIWPWKFKVKGQGQRYPSQRSIQLTHFLFVSHQLDYNNS